MTSSRDSKPLTAAAQNTQASNQPESRQRTPSQSYFSASPSPPPYIPPSPPPETQGKNVAFISRVMAGEFRRREYVRAGLQQLDMQTSACIKGLPIPELDSSSLDIKDFNQESSDENAVERFCVWDWAEDPNVIHARLAMAALEEEHLDECQDQEGVNVFQERGLLE